MPVHEPEVGDIKRVTLLEAENILLRKEGAMK